MPADVKSSVEAKIAAVRKALEGSDQNAITQATNELYQVVQTVGTAMYGQGGQPGPDAGGQAGPGPGDGGQHPGGDDVVEGEFKEA